MDTARVFSRQELAAALGFTVLAIGIGAGSYRIGQAMTGGNRGEASMSAAMAQPVVDGAALYAGTCAGCHGAAGGGGIGPALKETAG